MRLATFNLLHGRSVPDGVVDPVRLRDAVRRIDADVLGIQEVDRGQPRSARIDQTALVAEAVGAAEWRFTATLLGDPGGAWRPGNLGQHLATHSAGQRAGELAAVDPVAAAAASGAAAGAVSGPGADAGAGAAATARDDASASASAEAGTGPDAEPAYGIGLVSRLPVLAWHTFALPAAPFRAPLLLPGTARPVLFADEPRAGLAAVVETSAGPLTVVTAHLSFVQGWNAMQLRRLIAGLTALPGPVVLLGDLNLPGPLPGLLTRWPQWARTPTYPAWRPRVQLDHVLARNVDAVPGRVEALALPVSDHRALVVDVALG